MKKVGADTSHFPPELEEQAGSTLEEEHAEVGDFSCDKVYGDLPHVSEHSSHVHGGERLWDGAQYRRFKSEIKYGSLYVIDYATRQKTSH